MKDRKNRELATELNSLFNKSKKKTVNQEKVLEFLPKLSLQSLLKDDQLKDTNMPEIKVPKVSFLKGKEQKTAIKKFESTVKRKKVDQRETIPLPKEIFRDQKRFTNARSPSPEPDLKVCMIGRKLESPIRNLNGYELEPDLDPPDEIIEESVHDDHKDQEDQDETEILEPIVVIEEEEEKQLNIKKLKEVDDLFKKYTDVLNQKNQDLQNSRGSPLENFQFSSSLELLENDSLESLSQSRFPKWYSQADSENSGSFVSDSSGSQSSQDDLDFSQSLDYDSSFNESYRKASQYSESLRYSSSDNESFLVDYDYLERDNLLLERPRENEDYSDSEGFFSDALTVNPVKLSTPTHKVVLKKETAKPQSKKPKKALFSFLSLIDNDKTTYKPKRDIGKYVKLKLSN